MIKVLVTGGAGFIGSNFVRYALNTHPDWHVTTLDKLTYAGRRENLHDVRDNPRHTFVHGDILDAAVAGPLVEQADYVVHFAAETHVDRSILAAGEFIKTDVEGSFVLLEAARRNPTLTRFVQISTDEAYGTVPEGSSVETDELKPRNPYAASKAGVLGAVLLLGAVALATSGELALEAFLGLLILLASAPLAAHAIARAAHRAGIRPTLGRLGDKLEQRNKGGE